MIKKTKILIFIPFFFLISFQGNSENCITSECHSDFRKMKMTHAPIEDDCTSCHQKIGDHNFKLIQGKQLCYQCHDEEEEGKHVNEDIPAFDCIDCHNPHGGENKFLLKSEREDTLCYECHDSMNKKYIHKPMESGNCSKCHGFHSSNSPALLNVSKQKVCIVCHSDKDFSKGKRYMHDCLKGGCDDCHDSHSSDFKYQLVTMPGKVCVKCHEDFFIKSEKCKFKHPVLEQKNICLNCHDPHGSIYNNNLRVIPLNLCLDCHKDLHKEQGSRVYDIFEVIAKSKYKHGPIVEGNCSGCHDQHGSDYYKTLRRNYPSKFYTSFEVNKYALCFGCHKSTLVTVARTTTHTNFRDKNLNLHYVHVNKKKGRTCRVCHEVHAGNLPKHIRKFIPFGKWDLPIGFEKHENGGTCLSGCHKPLTYRRNKDKKEK